MAVIPKDQWRQRLRSALELKGQELKDLPVEIEGFPKNAATRAGHESDTYMATTTLARSVAEEIGFPIEWFTAEDFPGWLSAAAQQPAEDLRAQLLRIEQALGALTAEPGREIAARPSEQERPPSIDSAQEGSRSG